jgi:ABC-2 type transport system ATP-binding protein
VAPSGQVPKPRSGAPEARGLTASGANAQKIIATAIDPEILLLDEGLGTGDARFATRAAEQVKALIERSSIMVLASHSDTLIRQICKRAILIDYGRVIADGPTEEVVEIYARSNGG